MKGFNFKLEALLKLREFNEQKVKTEVGKVLREISDIKKKMKGIEDSIKETYQAQEEVMKQPNDAHMLKFFPFYLKSRSEDLKVQEGLLKKTNEKYEELLQELKKARGEVKVLDNMKAREKNKFKKNRNKKESENIEDILNLRRLLNKSE